MAGRRKPPPIPDPEEESPPGDAEDPIVEEIRIEPELRRRCPALRLGILAARVKNGPADPVLEDALAAAEREIASSIAIDGVKAHPAIRAAREAYKACGKDPNRYRPSAEALRRRVVRGKGLYRAGRLVDLVNLLSLRSGFSIGAFDADRIEESISLGIGREGEAYRAIGRGDLNIAGLPVLRDGAGAFGTPTSDHERTRLREDTRRMLMVVYGFGGPGGVSETLQEAKELLLRHAEAGEIETQGPG